MSNSMNSVLRTTFQQLINQALREYDQRVASRVYNDFVFTNDNKIKEPAMVVEDVDFND